MRYDIRYLRKHRGWPDLPKPLWQKIKRFLDEKTDGFRVEYDYKAVEVKPDVEFGSGFNIYLYEFGDLTFTLWRLSRIDAAECAVEELFGKCRVFV
jgi:hypothetical protein